jgi:hypothetical protein
VDHAPVRDRPSPRPDRALYSRDRRLLAGLLCLAGALAGCGSSSGGGPSKAQLAAADAVRPAAPGASLVIAQPATVIYRPPGSNASGRRLRIVVESIHRGRISDLKGLQLDADQRGAAPEYVKVEITNLGPGALSGADDNDGLPDSLMGIDNAGNQQAALTFIIGSFAPCDDKDVPDPLKPRQTYTTCLTFVVPRGITKVAYTGTQAYVESPVTWKTPT